MFRVGQSVILVNNTTLAVDSKTRISINRVKEIFQYDVGTVFKVTNVHAMGLFGSRFVPANRFNLIRYKKQ
jgi:hypothetical protein